MTLASFWAAVWPNLAANILWTVPLWFWHHSRIRRMVQRELREHRISLRIED